MTYDRQGHGGRVVVTVLLVIAALGVGLWVGVRLHARVAVSEQQAAKPKSWYTCGMHPQVRQDQPGNCPICQMKLTPVRKDQIEVEQVKGPRKVLFWRAPMNPAEIYDHPGTSAMGMDLVAVYEDELSAGGAIRIDPVLRQNMGIRTTEVARGPLWKVVRSVAYVDYDETTLANVTTKVSGWVEKLYVDQTGQQVHRGDALFELYSPALYSAQEEYLSALRNLTVMEKSTLPSAREDAQRLVEAAKVKLQYMDVSDEQVARLADSRQVRKTLVIRSPATGIVTSKGVVQGERITAGTVCYRIADISTVWVKAKIYEQDLPYVRLGQEVLMRLAYEPGVRYRGRITFIYPYLEQATREVTVRAEFHNPGYLLKPGMYATVEMNSLVTDDAILVSDTAVIHTGTRQVAFVDRGDGTFQPRKVSIGLRGGDNRVEVLSGLVPGEKVVVSGQFMLDSESRLREATMKWTRLGEVSPESGVVELEPDVDERPATTQPAVGVSHFACPMPAHASILYEQPGPCPLCRMAMVPTTWEAARRLAGPVKYWTCPMPEHSTVRQDGPGKCPLCSMTLVPITEEPTVEQAPMPKDRAADELPDLYTCPMESDVEVTTDKPGSCPKCGMKLVPVGQVGHALKAIEVYRSKHTGVSKDELPDLYTCPMESDVDVTTDTPGTCPKCGMKLVPIEQVGHAAKAIEVYRKKHAGDANSARPTQEHQAAHEHHRESSGASK